MLMMMSPFSPFASDCLVVMNIERSIAEELLVSNAQHAERT
jgi:hypothetical protein